MRPLPLRTSLTLLYACLLATVVAGAAVGYHRLLIRQVDADATRTLEEMVRGLHGYVRIDGAEVTFRHDDDDPDAAAFLADATRYYQAFDASGRRVAQSDGLAVFGIDYAAPEVAEFRAHPGMHDVDTRQGRVRVSTSLVASAGGDAYVLQVALPLEPTDRTVAAVERTLWWSILAGLVVAVFVGRWMAGRALAPLVRLAAATNAIDVRSLDQRLPVRGAGDELDTLTIGFNEALTRVDRAVGEMRQFSAALAHELRTPLAVIRGETELSLNEAATDGRLRSRLEGQLEELDRLSSMIGQILTLARAESGQISLVRTPVDLTALSRRMVDQLDVMADSKGLTLGIVADAAVLVAGDPGWLERLVLLLLDNALKFTPSGGRVVVTVDHDGHQPRLVVTDTGPGIPTEALPHIFERFFRVDPSRSRSVEGAGLGLALAKWIADQHAADITVANEPSGGARFAVRFPDRPSQALVNNR